MKNVYELAKELKDVVYDVFEEVEGSVDTLIEILTQNNINPEEANVIFEEFDYFTDDTDAGIRCIDGYIAFYVKYAGYPIEYSDQPYCFSLPSTKGLIYTLSQVI